MRTRTAIAAVLLLGATTTACSSETTNDKPSPAAAKTTSPAAETPAAKTAALALGTGRHWSDTDLDGSHISATTTAIGYTQPAKDVGLSDSLSDFPHPVWATLEVKLCADAKSTNVMTAQTPWSLGFPDSTRVAAPLISGSGVPKPEYPTESTAVEPGTCLRGKITFSVERGTRPNQIIYGPQGRDPIRWAVPKA